METIQVKEFRFVRSSVALWRPAVWLICETLRLAFPLLTVSEFPLIVA